jgi:hypothetical protein
MSTSVLSRSNLSMSEQHGEISVCPHQNCQFVCCDFAADNFIALYPGELGQAVANEISVDHLELTPDGHGGHRAICRARDRSSCDGGYKPLDCASYPFFPTVDDLTGNIDTGLKGQKCPLKTWHLSRHKHWVIKRWKALVNSVPGLANWIRQTKLIGYVRMMEDASTTDEFETNKVPYRNESM